MAYRFISEYGVGTPLFEILLDGKEVSGDFYSFIEEVEFDSNVSGSDKATVTVNDPMLQFLEDRKFYKGRKITIYGGWENDLVKWIDGYIAMVDVDFPDTGDPFMRLHCMDESFLLDRHQVFYSYPSMTFAQIAREIAERHGLTAEGPSTDVQHENINQSGETDIDLLTRMAEDEGLIVKIKNGKIQWSKVTQVEKEPQDELHWREYPYTLKSFRPRLAIVDQDVARSGSSVDDATKQVDDYLTEHVGDMMTSLGDEVFSIFEGWDLDLETGLWYRKTREGVSPEQRAIEEGEVHW